MTSQQKPQFFRFHDKPVDSKLTISGNDSSNLSSTIVSDTSSIVFNGDYVKVPKDTKFLMNNDDPDLDAHPNRLVSKIVHSIDVVSELKKDPNFQNYYTLLESKVIAAGAQNDSVTRSVLNDIKDQIDELVDDRAEMVHLYGNSMLANGHKNLSTVSASSNLDLSKAGIIKNNADLIFNNINGSGYQESLFQQYQDHYLPELLKVSNVNNVNNSGYQHIVDQQDPYKNLTLNTPTHLLRSNAQQDCVLIARRAQNIDFAVRKEYQTGVDFIKMVKESVDVDINFSELRMRQNWLPDNKTIHFIQFFDNGLQDLYSGGPVTDQGDLTQGTNANDAPHTFSEGDVSITIENTYIKRMHDASLDVTNTNGIKIVSGSLTSYRFGGDFNGLVEDIGNLDITSDQLQKNATSGSNLVEKLSMPNVWVLTSGSGLHVQTIALIEANVNSDTTTGLPSDWENAVCAVQDSTSNSSNPTYYSVDNLGADGMSGNPIVTNNTVILNENTANESIFNDMVSSMQNLDLLHYIE